MNREESMVKNTMILAVGKICTQFVSFLLLPVYTALLTTEEYGTVDLMHTYFSLLIPVVTLQIEQAVFRYLVEIRGDKEEQKKLISSAAAGVFVNILLYLILFLILNRWIHNEFKNYLVYNVVAGILSGILLQTARGLGDNMAYAVGSFLTALITVLLNVVFVVGFRAGASGMLLASMLGNAACVVYLFFRLKLSSYLSFSCIRREKIKEYYRYSIPMVPNGISWWLVSASDRVIISKFLGVGANGIYSAAHKFSSIYIMVYNIVNLTWTETAALHIWDKDRDEFFTEMITNIYSVFFSLCVLIVAVMPFAFPLLINEKFSAAYAQIPILMLASLFNMVVGLYSVVYIAEKKTGEIAKTSVASAAINIVVNFLLVKKIGIFAGSVSSLVAYGTMMVLRHFDVQKYVKMKLPKKMLFSSAALFGLVTLGYYRGSFLSQAVLLGAVIVFVLAGNRTLITGGKEMLVAFLKNHKR